MSPATECHPNRLRVRSFSALSAEDPGFRTDHRLVFSTPLPRSRYPGADERMDFTQRALAVLRASVPPASLIPAVRHAIAVVDPDEPLEAVMSADAMVADSISRPRFRTFLMTVFGLLALVLAVVGLYGVMAYSVSQRSKEIGVRMALGATRGSVLGLVFRQGAVMVGTGLVVGLAGALALSRVLQSLLFGVGAKDPAVFTAVPVVLAAVAAAAVFLPAHRAAGVDPVRTLGAE